VSSTRTQPNQTPVRSPRRRGLEIGGLVIGIVAGLSIALGWLITTRDQPSRPVVYSSHPPILIRGSSGASAEPDPAMLDSEWAAYSDRASCADWAGGDGVSAIRLNPSQLAWFFSDTYLGPAGPTIGFSRLSGFLHNSVVVQTTTRPGSTFVTLTGGGACTGLNGQAGEGDAAPVVGAPPTGSTVPADRYWEEDGLRTGGTIVKFYNHYLGGSIPFVPAGTVIATFGVSQLSSAGGGHQFGGLARPDLITLPSYTPPGGGTPILWGASLLRAGNTVYIYGTQSPDLSAPGRVLYLARVPVSQLTAFSAWRFYAGAGTWSADQAAARPVQPPGSGATVSSGFSVIQAGGRYWLIQAATAEVAPDIDAYPASAPWGPFDFAAGRLLYRDPGIGLDAAHDYRIMYEARTEPALSTSHTLVISYNINSEAVTTGCVPMSAYTNTVTLPRFIAVPLTAFGAGAGAGAGAATATATGAGVHVPAATSGPTDYPRIVAQNPSQWFDAWNYPNGCPPVPGVKSVLARPAAGRVRLSWPDAGLGVRYLVYLQGPGATGFRGAGGLGSAAAVTAYRDHATITGLQPGDYQATVVPANFRKLTGAAAKVTFTVP
jgi:hypothetical protein